MVLKHDFIRCVDFTRIIASNIESDESLIKSHIQYLIQSYHIPVLILYSRNWWKM